MVKTVYSLVLSVQEVDRSRDQKTIRWSASTATDEYVPSFAIDAQLDYDDGEEEDG
jgi:hypothetical protein